MVGKRLAQPFAVVVIAGHQVDGHGERREQFAQARVLREPAEIGEVAGNDHCIGHLPQRENRLDGDLQPGRGIDLAVGETAGFDIANREAISPALSSACDR